MKMHRVVASVLCMALLLALCLSVACSEEIMPFAERGATGIRNTRTEQDKPSCSVLHRKGGAIS